MSWRNVIDATKEVLESVEGVGKVHSGSELTWDQLQLSDLHMIQEPGARRKIVNSWVIRRTGFNNIWGPAIGEKRREHVLLITGRLSANGAEGPFQDLLDRIGDAFAADPQLGCRVWFITPIIIRRIDRDVLGSYQIFISEIELTATEKISI